MLKNISIGGLLLAVICVSVYAIILKEEAGLQTIETLEQKVLALENYEKAKREEEKAAEAAALARIELRKRLELEKQLENCR